MPVSTFSNHFLPLILFAAPLAIPAATLEPGYFPKSVYPIFQKAGCPACHNPDGVASGTRLRGRDGGRPQRCEQPQQGEQHEEGAAHAHRANGEADETRM